MTASTALGGSGRRVVLVAPEFPPANTAGAHRPRLFAKHLSRFGWTPTVLTIRQDQIEGPLDRSLETLLAPTLDVVRTGALPIRPIRLIGDLGIRSLTHHARALTTIVRQGGTSALVLFGPPWFSFLLGPFVGRRFGLPYVVDYIDPWISDWTSSHRFPSKGWFYHRAATTIEPAVLRSAAHITAVSPGILSDLSARYPWLDPTRLSAMPYGAEPDDYDQAESLGLHPPDFARGGDAIHICFTGALQPKGDDLLRAVLKALGRAREAQDSIGRRLRLHCYGTSNLTWGHQRHAVLPVARELGVADAVTELPERIPYLQAAAVLRSADIVLVMGSTDPYYHASKLYAAIAAGAPILAICHEESTIRTVMEKTGAGVCVTFKDAGELELAPRVEEIQRAIRTLVTRPRRATDRALVEPFSARASTRVLAGVLDRITRERPSVAEAS